MKDWKSTAAGILSAFLGTVGPLTGFLASWQNIQAQIPGHGPGNYTLALVGAGLTCFAAIARIWLGIIQKDTQPAQEKPNV